MIDLDAIIQKPKFVIYTISAFALSVLIWSYIATLDEVVVGQGKIKPRQQIQEIQSLEGGIIREFFVRTGQQVEAGEKLIQLDDIAYRAALNEQIQEMDRLRGHIAQLKAELEAADVINDASLISTFDLTPYINELPLSDREKMNLQEGFKASLNSLASENRTVSKRVIQAEKSLNEAISKRRHLHDNLKIAQQELQLNLPAYEKGAISGIEILKLRKNINDTKAELSATKFDIERKHKQIEEVTHEKETLIAKFQSNHRESLNSELNELSQLEANHIAIKDRLKRSIILSPVPGIIKSINTNTRGGVIQPGETIIEIVPLDSKLLVEIQIKPQDIGFIRLGLPTLVKLTAYDFVIYGGLRGELSHISADTILNEEGDAFYVGHVLLDNTITDSGHYLDLIPGMQASVDIIAGEKTIMQYWLKPILRAQSTAMREI